MCERVCLAAVEVVAQDAHRERESARGCERQCERVCERVLGCTFTARRELPHQIRHVTPRPLRRIVDPEGRPPVQPQEAPRADHACFVAEEFEERGGGRAALDGNEAPRVVADVVLVCVLGREEEELFAILRCALAPRAALRFAV